MFRVFKVHSPDGVNFYEGEAEALTRCAAARDGECFHAQCPQIKDGEPAKSGRHCPIDNWDDKS